MQAALLAMNPVCNIMSSEGFWALVGAVLGALLSYCAQLLLSRSQRRDQETVAAMQVAGILRRWMAEIAWTTDMFETYLGSEGHGGAQFSSIPDFQFDHMNEIGRLENKLAQRVLDLIHRRHQSNIDIDTAIEYLSDDDDIANNIFINLTQLYLLSHSILVDMYGEIKWDIPNQLSKRASRMRDTFEKYSAAANHDRNMNTFISTS